MSVCESQLKIKQYWYKIHPLLLLDSICDILKLLKTLGKTDLIIQHVQMKNVYFLQYILYLLFKKGLKHICQRTCFFIHQYQYNLILNIALFSLKFYWTILGLYI